MPADNCARTGYGNAHPFFQVDASADDILDLSAADVHLAHSQSVRIGMGFDLFDDSHQHIVKTTCKIFHVLHFHCGHGQVVRQFFQIRILRNIHIILDP